MAVFFIFTLDCEAKDTAFSCANQHVKERFEGLPVWGKPQTIVLKVSPLWESPKTTVLKVSPLGESTNKLF
jgi:hypothetical protein